MNILFLTLVNMENIDERGIYTDLVREFAERGINIYVVSPREKRVNLPTVLDTQNNIKVLKVKTGNITKTGFVEKGLSTILIERQYLNAIKKYFKDIQFDMVLYSTPPITFEKVVRHIKNKCNSKTYLMLKDIFPQNAVDIQVIKKNSLIWKYFRRKEHRLYEISDVIGCMSQGNVEYLLEHNPGINKEKVEVFPNSIKPVPRLVGYHNNNRIREKYKIPTDSLLFIYGGNLGKPQGIDFLMEVIERFALIEKTFLLIVGSGSEYEKLRELIDTMNSNNVVLLEFLPKHEYDQLLETTDVGLIFLDKRFTIPNFPSRLTSYMEYSIPILAATDKNTDLKEVIMQSRCGLWSESGDIRSFMEHIESLIHDKNTREEMGVSGRVYLENNYEITKSIEIIIKHL